MDALITHAQTWLDHDPDPETRTELAQLIAADNRAELADRFQGPLEFGTAGLRGQVEAGESRMNLATVSRATFGLAAFLNQTIKAQGGDQPLVVVGCDARHGSEKFHQAACEILTAAGCTVYALPPQLPTPITAFAVRYFGADAGVMITASHNPPKDNGYKVYLGGRCVTSDAATGVQLISPADTEIAAAITNAPPADDIARDLKGITTITQTEILEPYFEAALNLPREVAKTQVSAVESDLSIVITAMHGVGGQTLLTVLDRAGFSQVTPVSEQQQPDPDFPTVQFPNPEEPGALDLAYATAEKVQAELILALDPDADRCSVAIKTDGAWRQLSGDEVGAILGEDIARENHGNVEAVLACSIVSSQLLGKIAAAHGMGFAQTLTGFKWIARTPGLVFGYEEALGYCSDPTQVRDKDGITACLRVADLANRLRATGRNLQDFLDEIAADYGLHLTSPLTFRMEDPADIRAALAQLRNQPPMALADAAVTEFVDLSAGFRGLPPTDGLWLTTTACDRIVVRPSGTEPKLKCYLEVVAATKTEAQSRIDALKRDLCQALGL